MAVGKTLHMVANAHIDPVWLWMAAEGRQEVIDTCRSALERMEETDEFVFCRSSAATYQWLETAAPHVFAQVQARVAERRWIPVGGWWVQPDCNIPSGESLIRQGLVGKAYFLERFGVDVPVGYNVDSFGHAWTLPQLMAGMGLQYYVFFRPGPHERALPSSVFLWQAPDGSRVLAARPPGHYNTGPHDITERVREAAAAIPEGLADGMAFFGVGNHGGGPTRANIASIVALRGETDLPALKFSHPRAFFEAVKAAQCELPVVNDELQHHARGCYTSMAAIKKANRRAENALLSAELWSSLARAMAGRAIDRSWLRGAWRTVLFNQFHDILAGTSIRAACDETLRQNRLVIDYSNNTTAEAAATIAALVDTADGAGASSLVLFNPLGWERDDLVMVEVNWRAPAGDIRVETAEGVPVDSQTVASHWSGGGRTVRALVRTVVAPCGYTTLRVRPTDAEGPAEGHEGMDGRVLDNGLLRLTLGDRASWITRLEDLEYPAEVTGVGCGGLVVIDDPSDTWSHGVDAFRAEVGEFERVAQPRVLEWGPLRKTVELEGRWGGSRAWQEFSLEAGRRQVNVRLVLDWHEKHRMLKLRLPTRILEGEATFEIPYGAIVRPATGNEEPGQRWVDLSGYIETGDGRTPYGVALLNDCKYGFDVNGSEIRMSLLRSPIYAFHDPAQVVPGESYEYMDQGRHVIRYAIVPHPNTWREAQVVRRAAELNRPYLVLQEPAHDGPLPPSHSFVAVDRPNVDVEAVKPAEDREDTTIVRLRETMGRATKCHIEVAATPAVQLSFRAWEIKTLAVERRNGGWYIYETDLLERPLEAEASSIG